MPDIYVPYDEVKIETIKEDNYYYHKVWAQITDDLQITMCLDLPHINQIVDCDLRETYSDDEYSQNVRDAIKTLLREVYCTDQSAAEARIKSYEAEHTVNLICALED